MCYEKSSKMKKTGKTFIHSINPWSFEKLWVAVIPDPSLINLPIEWYIQKRRIFYVIQKRLHISALNSRKSLKNVILPLRNLLFWIFLGLRTRPGNQDCLDVAGLSGFENGLMKNCNQSENIFPRKNLKNPWNDKSSRDTLFRHRGFWNCLMESLKIKTKFKYQVDLFCRKVQTNA